MEIMNILKATVFMFLVVLGLPGNVFILLKFACVKISEGKLLVTNTILMFLSAMNLFVVLSRVFLQILHAVGVENFMDDNNCRFAFFIYRVGRAMSICVTGLLSCYQCILIAPNKKLWMILKLKATKHSLFCIISILIFINCCFYTSALLYNSANRNSTTSPFTLHLVYCHTDFRTSFSYVAYGTIYTVRDFLCVGVMTLASSYIVYILLSHRKTSKYFKKSDSDQSTSMEYKASRAIILLVALYVIIFGLENIIWLYTLTISSPNIAINDVRIVLSCSYAALSPVVIIRTNPQLHKNVKTLIQIQLQSGKRKRNVACVSGSVK
ncbi:hypothetical protein GDO86_003256 [Hymenochirus boettgeri]|uniref:Vomeronasal type-1 receptor n=1 Tax=Hymenochirus boettgeri TaxID=247094 RepID=A0A8T2K2R0_9PIPI|nr:hypothetical protein GDO86_003256 [Hymenochirus boettgeri]